MKMNSARICSAKISTLKVDKTHIMNNPIKLLVVEIDVTRTLVVEIDVT